MTPSRQITSQPSTSAPETRSQRRRHLFEAARALGMRRRALRLQTVKRLSTQFFGQDPAPELRLFFEVRTIRTEFGTRPHGPNPAYRILTPIFDTSLFADHSIFYCPFAPTCGKALDWCEAWEVDQYLKGLPTD
jgi:hypothetical protein